MSPDAIAIAGIVAVLLPTLYYLIASPTFLLANFADPIVTNLFRDLVSFNFKLAIAGAAIGSFALDWAGRPEFGICLVAIAVASFAARRWFLVQLNAGDSLGRSTVPFRRKLHRLSMAYNAVQLFALLSLIPFVFAG